MRNSEFWLSAQTEAGRTNGRAKVGPVRVALLFGTMAVAMALLLPPIVGDNGGRLAYRAGVDPIATGSVPQSYGTRQYTVRRSILQEPGGFCIVEASGQTRGNC